MALRYSVWVRSPFSPVLSKRVVTSALNSAVRRSTFESGFILDKSKPAKRQGRKGTGPHLTDGKTPIT